MELSYLKVVVFIQMEEFGRYSSSSPFSCYLSSQGWRLKYSGVLSKVSGAFVPLKDGHAI